MSRLALPTLWLPDRLAQRREDERLLRGHGGLSQRWMPGYPCCCGKTCKDCCQSGSWPDDISVDLTALDVRPLNEFAICDATEVNQIFVATLIDADQCIWLYEDASSQTLVRIHFQVVLNETTGECIGNVTLRFYCISGNVDYLFQTDPFTDANCASFAADAEYVSHGAAPSCLGQQCIIFGPAGQIVGITT